MFRNIIIFSLLLVFVVVLCVNSSYAELTIDQTGKVGIGITSPNRKLDVNGDIRVRGGEVNSNANIWFETGADIEDQPVSSGGGFYLSKEDGPIFFRSGSQNLIRMSILTDGNVGIGTTGPGEALELQSSSGKPSLRLHKPGVVEYNFGIRSDNSLTIGSARGAGDIDSGRPFVLTNSGNVGIGTTTPGSKLEINTWTGSAPGGLNPILKIVGGMAGSPGQGHTIDFHVNSTSSYPSSQIIHSMSDGTGGELRFATTEDYINQSPTDRLTIKDNGNVGIGTTIPTHPLEMGSGAHVTSGGVWTNASSREYKENIHELAEEDALKTIQNLKPVTFNYKADKNETYVGFIAEDVPNLVATNDRKSLSPMDIVSVLTKVVQKQQEEIEELKTEKEKLEDTVSVLADRQKIVESLLMAMSSNLPKDKLVMK